MRAHQDSDFAYQGSLGLMGTKIWLNVVHRGSSAIKLGSMGVIWGHLDSGMAHQGLSGLIWLIWDAGSLGVAGAHQDSDLAHWAHLGSLVVIEIQIWLNGGHLNCDLVHWGLLGLMGTFVRTFGFECHNLIGSRVRTESRFLVNKTL